MRSSLFPRSGLFAPVLHVIQTLAMFDSGARDVPYRPTRESGMFTGSCTCHIGLS
jgi:hypothetical protein